MSVIVGGYYFCAHSELYDPRRLPAESSSLSADTFYSVGGDTSCRPCRLSADEVFIFFPMEVEPIQTFLRNGRSGRWKVKKGVVVALTHSGLYYAGRAVIQRVVEFDPIVVVVKVIEVSDSMEMNIPFPDEGVKSLSNCLGQMILWEAADLRPFGEVEDDDINAVGCPPTDVEEDVKPVQEFLDLAEQMEVALLEESGGSKRCVAAGVIMECSPKGTWEGFLIPHSFFLIVRVSSVNPEFSETPAFCELPDVLTIGCAVGRLVLWSGYKVCPLVNGALAGTCPVGCPPTEPHLGNKDEEIDESNSAPSEQDLGTRSPMNISSDNDVSKQGESDVETDDHCWGPDSGTSGIPSTPDASYPDRHLWRNRYVELLNDDLSVRGRAMIQVCLPDEACDDEVLGDTEVGVLFVSEDDHLQMTTLRWRLTHTRLEGGHLLSDIITYCSENLADADADDGLDGVPKNAYRSVRRKVREKDDVSSTKLRRMVVPAECRLVSSKRCCKDRCCQTFRWEDTVRIRRRFYATTFEARREMSFAVQGHLHTVPGKRKLYVTLANVDVCEVAWYIIHGVSKSAYYSYKASARSGRVNGSHGNSGVHRPQIHTIQARAMLTTIVNENADQMPNEFRMIGKKRVAALKVLPSAMNWNHMREMANAVSSSSSSFTLDSLLNCSDYYRRLPADWMTNLPTDRPHSVLFRSMSSATRS